MNLIKRRKKLLIILFVFVVGCKSMQDVVIKKENTKDIAIEERKKPPALKELPDNIKTARSLWDYIKSENYKENWNMWPGKTSLYKINDASQHTSLLITYVNTIAYNTIINKIGLMPYESIIITENYNSDKALSFITAMYKRDGYNPEVNDWFWVKYNPEGEVMSSEIQGSNRKLAGKVTVCINCHKENINNDCIFTDNLSMKYGY